MRRRFSGFSVDSAAAGKGISARAAAGKGISARATANSVWRCVKKRASDTCRYICFLCRNADRYVSGKARGGGDICALKPETEAGKRLARFRFMDHSPQALRAVGLFSASFRRGGKPTAPRRVRYGKICRRLRRVHCRFGGMFYCGRMPETDSADKGMP